MDEQDQPDLLPYMAPVKVLLHRLLIGDIGDGQALPGRIGSVLPDIDAGLLQFHACLPEIGGLVAVGLIAKVIFLQKIAQLPLGSGILGQRLRIRNPHVGQILIPDIEECLPLQPFRVSEDAVSRCPVVIK